MLVIKDNILRASRLVTICYTQALGIVGVRSLLTEVLGGVSYTTVIPPVVSL